MGSSRHPAADGTQRLPQIALNRGINKSKGGSNKQGVNEPMLMVNKT